MKTCEKCGIEHEGEYASGRFCSPKCSRGFSTKSKRSEINEKVSKKLKKIRDRIFKTCFHCGKKFEVSFRKRNQKTCSLSCSSKLRWKDEAYKKRISELSSKSAYRKHADPNIKFGWTTRKKLQMSYPEKIANGVLRESGISYEYEYPFYNFFIDFAILDKKIAIEIDGRQHQEAKRKQADDRKDEKLKKEGWTIFRIKWPEDNIKEEIKKILKSIPSH